MKNRFRLNSGLDLGFHKPNCASQGLVREGIFDSNIDTGTPGSIRIALWREWPPMLSDLSDVGPVWSIVRNGHCVLAVHGDYPNLAFSPNHKTALARTGDHSLMCNFAAWQQAAAFESGCRCGKLFGVEIGNNEGQIFHRICLAKETGLKPFTEWTQMHQATGLEEEEEISPLVAREFHPQSFRRIPGTLEVPLDRLRTVLIHAAQREIPLMTSVASVGVTQTARIDVTRASEANGWLVLSGNRNSLYVEAEPTGALLLEPAMMEGESMWRLSLVDDEDHRLTHVQSTVDGRDAWNQLIRELVLCSTASER